MQVKCSREIEEKQIEEQEKQKEIAKKTARDLTPMVKGNTQKAAKKAVRDLAQVRRIFDSFDEDSSGYIEKLEFLPLLAKLLKQPKSEMDATEVWKHYDQIDHDGSGQLSFDEFQKWYCAVFKIDGTPDFTNFFTEDLVEPWQREMREVAKKLDMSYMDTEKLWTEFNRLDSDKSGCLEKSEVGELIKKQLSSTRNGRHAQQTEVPSHLLNKFWRDLDVDGSGSVTFEEFAAWYNQAFVGEESPIEQFYSMLGSGYRSRAHSAAKRDRLSSPSAQPVNA
jgi:Ca2+-binding EF-hand superfamily protein